MLQVHETFEDIFVCKQKTAYEMRISDWSSDVCSSDLAALSPLTVGAQELRLTAENRRSLILTVYNQNLGLVSETRRVELPAGETVLALEDVSSQLQPETVLLAAPGLRVIEQSLAGDLLTPQRLLEASLGETVQKIGRASCRDRVCQYV